MSKPITQTLFTFRTMRSPELISSENKESYFIEHFDGVTGDFFDAIDQMDPGGNKKEALEIAAANFQGSKTKEEIIAIDSDLYDFGLMLLKNKKTLTVGQVTTAISGLTVLSSQDLEIVWENLFYQTITLNSGYAREAALIMILANHIVDNFSSIPSTDKDMQDWAGSRIVLPALLFKPNTITKTNSTENEDATGNHILEPYMDSALAKITIEQVEKAKTEILAYKTNFFKINDALEKTAINNYNVAIKSAIDSATKADYLDQFSGYTFQKLTDYQAPTYTYVKPPEIDSDEIEQEISEESNFILVKYGLYNSKTFDELEASLDKISTDLTSSIFTRTSFYDESIEIGGAIIPKCSIDKKSSKLFVASASMIERSTQKHALVLTVNVGNECLKLEKATTLTSLPQSSAVEHITKISTNNLGVVTIDLTDGKSIDMGQNQSIDFEGELIFNNGLKLAYASQQIGLIGRTNFELVQSNNSTPDYSQSDLQIPQDYGIKILGISEYRKVEQTLCCYVPGEVSHIENVMAREYKERSTRRLRSSEDTTTEASSSENEKVSDTSSTTRFEIKDEISSILNESNESGKTNGVNSNLSGTKDLPLVGDVNFSVGANFTSNFSNSNSLQNSSSTASTFAKDVTEKALDRVVNKVSKERITRIVEEFEEKNLHALDNRKGAEHISGVYRWVDKIYKNEIHNYGKRLQF